VEGLTALQLCQQRHKNKQETPAITMLEAAEGGPDALAEFEAAWSWKGLAHDFKMAAVRGDDAKLTEILQSFVDVSQQKKIDELDERIQQLHVSGTKRELHEAEVELLYATEEQEEQRAGTQEMMCEMMGHGDRWSSKQDKESTALVLAANNGHVKCVQVLIEAKADLNDRDSCQRTPLHAACSIGHITVARALHEAKADLTLLEATGGTALHVASKFGSVELCAALLEWKVDINTADKYGSTPLKIAHSNRHVKVVELLQANGGDLEATVNVSAFETLVKQTGVGTTIKKQLLHKLGKGTKLQDAASKAFS